MAKLTDEQREKALELRGQGLGYEKIAKEIGSSATTVYRMFQQVGGAASKEPHEFLDTEARFLNLLQSYAVQAPERIVAYVSSLAEDIFSSPGALRKALSDQLVTPSKALSIVKHWCSMERLSVPEELARESIAESTQKLAQKRFSVIGGDIVADPDGEFNFIEALKLIEVKGGQTPSEGGELRRLEEEVKELRESLHKQEMETVKNAVVALSNQLTELRKEIAEGGRLEGRYAILDKSIEKLSEAGQGIRSDFRPLLTGLAVQFQPATREKSPEDKARYARELKKAVGKEQEARALEDELLFGKPPPGGSAKAEAVPATFE